jgi:hypothetical protein
MYSPKRPGRHSISLLLCLVLGVALPAAAAPVVLRNLEEPVSLAVPWKFHTGDDPTWSDPEYDDSEWMEMQIPPRVGQRSMESGFAWFRLEVQVGSPENRLWEREDLGLGLTLGKVNSAYEVYAGGILLGGVGSLPPNPEIDFDRHRVYAVPTRAMDGTGRLVLALRVWKSADIFSRSQGPHHGPFFLGKHVELARRLLLSDLPHLFLVGLFFLLGLYHLELWRRWPRQTLYAWFGASAMGLALHVLLFTQWKYLLKADYMALKELQHLTMYLLLATFIQLFWSLLDLRIGWLPRTVQVVSVMSGLVVALTPGLWLNLFLLPIFEAVALMVCGFLTWTVFRNAWRAPGEARLIAIGVLLMLLTVVHDIALDRGFLVAKGIMVFGFAGFILSLAMTLFNRFQRTHVELEELRFDLEQRGDELARQLAARQRLEEEREEFLREMDANRTLDKRLKTLDRFAAEESEGELARLARSLVRQDRLYAKLLRAESPAHLAALRDELQEIEEEARKATASASLPQSDFLAELRLIFEGLESLERLPSSEDQTLVLRQALTRALALQEQQASSQPALGGLALEAMREVFVTALGDLHHSARLELELRSREVTTHRETVVVLELRNTGKGPASDIVVRLTAETSALHIRRNRQHLKSLLAGQSARLEFLVEPRESERIRLAFHLTWNDLERRGKELDFADVMQLHRFQNPDVFRPLRPNPYVVGRPLLASDYFFGREELFARLNANFQGSTQDNIVVLIGERRMGKTSILRRLHLHLSEYYMPVLVDLQGILGSGEATFFADLADQISDELEDRGLEIVEPDPALASDPGNFFRRRFLPDVCAALNGRRLLIVFDEMEVLEERIRAGELKAQMLHYLRSLMQHEEQISFLLAGTHRLEELTATSWGVLFNLAVYLEVGHLSENDVSELLQRPLQGHLEIDSLALEKIYRTTGGHPHFSQLLARELVERCNRHRISYVTVQDVNEVIDVVADAGQLHIAYLWTEASRDEQLLMLAVKDLLEREGLASIRTAHRYLERWHITPSDLPGALHRLQRRQILHEEGGRIIFRIDLLRRWLGRRYDLESFALA